VAVLPTQSAIGETKVDFEPPRYLQEPQFLQEINDNKQDQSPVPSIKKKVDEARKPAVEQKMQDRWRDWHDSLEEAIRARFDKSIKELRVSRPSMFDAQKSTRCEFECVVHRNRSLLKTRKVSPEKFEIWNNVAHLSIMSLGGSTKLDFPDSEIAEVKVKCVFTCRPGQTSVELGNVDLSRGIRFHPPDIVSPSVELQNKLLPQTFPAEIQ
jgi:hypothetical protein